ncbi:MAG: amidohydrolase family protein [Novosphingobium sp.]|nr:amidohydrolase family protein [Novosphingobium sp.]
MAQPHFDLIIRGGTIIDGSGGPAYRGDVGITGEWIEAVGEIEGTATREIDATGKLVTPGFVDIHTHYDGQLVWSERLSPSSDHGVTTVVTGNCGIGFAPCKPDDRLALVEMMEGVEDIPEAVATAGLTWEWESFPEFLDLIEKRPHDIDFAAYLPHSPLRVYVMGERAINREEANPQDLAQMKRLTSEALEAGAMGLGTSRMSFHRTSKGELIPSIGAAEEELHVIAEAMTEADRGILQFVSVMSPELLQEEFGLMRELSTRSGRTLTYTQAQTTQAPDMWRDILEMLQVANDNGANMKAQLFPRPIGMIIGLRASANPFCMAPSWAEIADLPLAEKVERMRDPDLRRRLITEEPEDPTNPLFNLARKYEMIFPLDAAPNYEPDRSQSIAELAKAAGVSSDEYIYDRLLDDDGEALLLTAIGNYADYNLDFIREMLADSNVVVGLGDGGAHYGMICDASYSTYALTHWARDRERDQFSIEQTVRMLTREPAEVVGLTDRGLLQPGHRAHANVIDHDRLTLHRPGIIHDLPGGGKRLHQTAEGYVATICNGAVIMEDGQPTGALPGRLLRGAQPGPDAQPEAVAAE